MDEIWSETDPMTLEIIHAGRRFPLKTDLPKLVTRGPVRKLQTKPSDDSLPQRLAEAIGQRLPWQKIQSTENPDRDTVVAAYIGSIKQLDVFREDIQRVIHEACRANLEFRQDSGETHVEARDASSMTNWPR